MRVKLVLIRGLSGSGKSTLAKVEYPTFDHYEADMFFELKTGVYQFDRSQLKRAHQWCQRQTKNALRNGRDCVVSNTFVKRWEIAPYYQIADELYDHGIIVDVQERIALGEYANVHNVPQDVLERQRKMFEV